MREARVWVWSVRPNSVKPKFQSPNNTINICTYIYACMKCSLVSQSVLLIGITEEEEEEEEEAGASLRSYSLFSFTPTPILCLFRFFFSLVLWSSWFRYVLGLLDCIPFFCGLIRCLSCDEEHFNFSNTWTDFMVMSLHCCVLSELQQKFRSIWWFLVHILCSSELQNFRCSGFKLKICLKALN